MPQTTLSADDFIDFFENSALGLHCVASDGTIIHANQTELDMLGYQPQEYIGHHIAEFHADPEVIADILRRLAARETLRDYPARLVCKDGHIKHVLINSNVRWDGSKFLHTPCVTRDVTEQKLAQDRLRDLLFSLRHAEAESRRLNEELERRVEERTEGLSRALADQETFAYTVAHDLRAPLRAAHGFGQILLQRHGPALPSDARALVERIVAAGKRMDALINALLAYSRLGRQDLVVERLDLDALADQVLSHMGEQLDAAEIRVERPLPSPLGHAATVAQALTNLLSNAVKYVRPGVRPSVRVVGEARDGWARIWVEDNGIGIAPEHHERVFKVFERLHPDASYPGTGIGLAVVKRAIERLGGAVGVESALGQGSRFWIELPLEEDPA